MEPRERPSETLPGLGGAAETPIGLSVPPNAQLERASAPENSQSAALDSSATLPLGSVAPLPAEVFGGTTLAVATRIPNASSSESLNVDSVLSSTSTLRVETSPVRLLVPETTLRLEHVSGSRSAAPRDEPPILPNSPFRENAVRAKLEEPPPLSLPQVSTSRWVVLGFVSSAVVTALLAAFVGQVEVTALAQGAVVVAGGPRPVVNQASGPVAELLSAPGEHVVAGQALARIDSAELEARKQRSETQVSLVAQSLARINEESARLHAATLNALKQKRALLLQRASLKRVSQGVRSTQADKARLLAKEGAISEAEAITAQEQRTSASEDILVISQQVADIDFELNDRERIFAEQKRARERELEEVKAGLEEAKHLIAQSTVRAPLAGRVESLLAARGQVVPSGGVFARIIPDGALTHVVVFAPAKDAGFLEPGLKAQLELASFPVGEFGRLKATVSRVSNDVASGDELTQVLGSTSSEALVRVELQFEQGENLDRVSQRLRSGERVLARINTRKRRVITLLFDFLRRWFPS
jgi:multidrug resistance efflux pump